MPVVKGTVCNDDIWHRVVIRLLVPIFTGLVRCHC